LRCMSLLLALFGHGAMSDLSPLCSQERTSTETVKDLTGASSSAVRWPGQGTIHRGFAFEIPEGPILKQSPLRLPGITGDRECCAPAYSRESIVRQSQSLSSAIPFAAIARPACPKCKARMMLASIEPARAGVDLLTFECAICNHELRTLIAHEDPMKSTGLGRWLQGDLHPPK
jgi:hypothetical protein